MKEKKRRGSGKAPVAPRRGKGIMNALEPIIFPSHSTARAGFDMTAATDTTIRSKIGSLAAATSFPGPDADFEPYP